MKRVVAFFLMGFGICTFAYQSQGEIIHVPPKEVVEGNNLTIEAIYTGDLSEIQDAKILYRLAGQVGYLEQMMNLGDLKLSGDLPGEIIGAPGIEYVIVISLKNGGLVAYPANDDPLSDPQYLSVAEPEFDPTSTANGPSGAGELIILTPDAGTIVPFGEEMIVAVSLFNLSNVDINSVRVFFDNVDVTAYSLVTTDLVTYKPEAVSAGTHTIFIEVSNIYGVRLSSTSWNYIIRSQAQQIFEMDVHGNLNLSHRQDLINISETEVDTVIDGDSLSLPIYEQTNQGVSRADFTTSINFDWAKIKVFGNITSKEDSTLQPQNRYGVKVRTSWLKYAFGDETPMMNKLALYGKRVRGHNIDLRFKYMNLHIVSGQTARAITGKASFDSTGSEWKRSGYSFERGIFAIRPSFGTGKNFQLGMFYVHTRDSVNSVVTRPGWWDGTNYSHEMVSEFGDISVPFGVDEYTLGDTSIPIQYFLRGSNPEDNVVVGTDLEIAFDNHRFVIESSVAFSLYNRNISDGPLTRAQLDTFGLLSDTTLDGNMGTGSFGDKDSEGNKEGIPLSNIDDMMDIPILKSLLDDQGMFDPANLADFFIINENLTLPVDVENISNGNVLAGLSTLAMHYALKLNYYGNFVHIDYHHVGPGYKALGSPVLRLDGKGWNGWKITDKIRMLNNMLYLNLGWQSYKNNTTSQDPIDDPRLVQNAFSGGITLNPGRGLPTVSTNIKFFSRDNNIDEVTQTIVGDTTIVTDSRELNESLSSNVNLTYLLQTGQINNTLSFNMMRSNMDNLVIGNEGMLRSSNLLGINIRSDWGIPLTTTLAVRNNTNQLYEENDPNYQTNTFNTFRLGAGYRLFGSHLVLRGNFQFMTFESTKMEDDGLAKSEKTQTNMQFNTQYTFGEMNIGSSVIKSRVIASFEQRNYVSDHTDYTDNMLSARFEMTF